MKTLLPLAVLLAFTIAGCSKTEPKPDPKPDPYAKYRGAQVTVGMKIADIKQQFGEPDSFDDWWNKDPNGEEHYGWDYSQESPERPHHVEKLNYGAFGAHSQTRGHITKHRLSMTFVDGKLYSWEKSTPVDRE